MGLRPGRCYRNFQRPYTRQSQKKPKKGYVKGVPKAKIAQFEFGKKGSYEKKVFLVSKRNVQIRHNSLESARVSTVQILEKNLAKGMEFFFKVRVYPHQVLRENALATGAGADRFQEGMRHNFGKPIGTAARVHKDQKVFEIQVNASGISVAKEAFKSGMYKLPTPCRIVVE